jgi:hypothetical protein
MDVQDLKLYLVNSLSLIISLSNIEMTLKIVLLLASIGYTITKWIEIYKKKDNDGSKN